MSHDNDTSEVELNSKFCCYPDILKKLHHKKYGLGQLSKVQCQHDEKHQIWHWEAYGQH